jgi:hypothetical protein
VLSLSPFCPSDPFNPYSSCYALIRAARVQSCNSRSGGHQQIVKKQKTEKTD